jgi:hypothetical protein
VADTRRSARVAAPSRERYRFKAELIAVLVRGLVIPDNPSCSLIMRHFEQRELVICAD